MSQAVDNALQQLRTAQSRASERLSEASMRARAIDAQVATASKAEPVPSPGAYLKPKPPPPAGGSIAAHRPKHHAATYKGQSGAPVGGGVT